MVKRTIVKGRESYSGFTEDEAIEERYEYLRSIGYTDEEIAEMDEMD